MDVKSGAAELAVAGAASKSTWMGALIGFFGWAGSNQGVGLIGVAIALCGLGVNWYFKAKSDRRAEELHRLCVENLRRRKTDT